MELFFETRLEVGNAGGKVYFFQAKPEIVPEPVFAGETDFDGAGVLASSIIKDGGMYRMWYSNVPSKGWSGLDPFTMCYAESDNGIDWKRPTLNLEEFGGSKANNLTNVGLGGASVFIDPTSPASHRYRAVGFGAPGQFMGNPGITDLGF